MNDAVLILQSPFNEEESASRYDQTIALIEVGRDDHIRNSGFVFHRDEDEPFGCTRPLPRDYATRRSDQQTVAAPSQIPRR
jgi:hypothetical protein